MLCLLFKLDWIGLVPPLAIETFFLEEPIAIGLGFAGVFLSACVGYCDSAFSCIFKFDYITNLNYWHESVKT